MSSSLRGAADHPGHPALHRRARSPTRPCATSSSPPRGPRAARTDSPSASSCCATGRGRRGQALIGVGRPAVLGGQEGGGRLRRGRAPTRTRPRRGWRGPCSTTSTPSSRCRCWSWPATCPTATHTAESDGASIYPACQNLLLAARALGYGGVLTGWHYFAEAELQALLQIPDEVELMATITLGPAAGTSRAGAPAAAPRAGVRGTLGVAPPWAVDPEGAHHTAAGPPRPAHRVWGVAHATPTEG